MSHKKTSVLIILLSIIIVILFLLIIRSPSSLKTDYTFNGTYTYENIIVSINERENIYYYFDQNNVISKVSQDSNKYSQLSDTTLCFNTNSLDKTIVVLTPNGITLIVYTSESIKCIDLKKQSSTITEQIK